MILDVAALVILGLFILTLTEILSAAGFLPSWTVVPDVGLSGLTIFFAAGLLLVTYIVALVEGARE